MLFLKILFELKILFYKIFYTIVIIFKLNIL